MKNYLLLALLFFTAMSSAQNNWCGFDAKMEEQFALHPGLRDSIYDRFAYISANGSTMQDREDVVIPVVVHVLHDNGIGNISMSQIQSALEVLNEDFNLENSDISSIRNTPEAPFFDVKADIGIKFELAKIDPDGNCTNGVERRNSAAGSYDGNDQTSKKYNGGGLNAWDRNSYFNIWVVNSIEYSGDLENGVILGYAQFPASGSANEYGVIIRNDRFGVGTDRTITHEIGHCLGLYHTFQWGCGEWGDCGASGDGCCDTPPVDEAHWSCGSSQNHCDYVATSDFYQTDVLDQFENFMSYSPCQYMFTGDQKNIVLSNLSDIGHLSNLTSAQNLIDVGLNSAPIVCKAEFFNSNTTICAGQTVDFSDVSYFGITQRDWSFMGGTPNQSSDSSVTITYNTAGVYSVELEVGNGIDSETTTVQNLITVLPNPGAELPYFEGFETADLNDNYYHFVINENLGSESWEVTGLAASTGDKSLTLQNFNEDEGEKDSYISQPINIGDLDDEENLLMTFKYAYNQRHTNDFERLKVYVSSDCGENWVLREHLVSSDINDVVSSTNYVPSNEMEWKTVIMENIHPAFYVPNLRFKIEFTSDNGNNIYIDDINLYPESWVSSPENNFEMAINVFPNPTKNETTISYYDTQSNHTQITLFDIQGNKIKTVFNGLSKGGKNKFKFDVSNYAAGVYMLNITNAIGSKTVRLVVD